MGEIVWLNRQVDRQMGRWKMSKDTGHMLSKTRRGWGENERD